jgi:large subunit ribosomal protein L5
MNELKEKYIKEVAGVLQKKYGYKSLMAIPKITKVVINVGAGKKVSDKDSSTRKAIIADIVKDITTITGQKAMATKAKKSIATFKLREGNPIGVKVTLRGEKMYGFLEKLINIVLPGVRDFQGLKPTAFDKHGNMAIGLKEHIVFPEILPEKTKTHFGLEVIIVTTAKTIEEGKELMTLMGLPFKKDKK